jgi:hypothetical protein
MLKKITLIMVCWFLPNQMQANVQVAIPLKDFQHGNAVVLIARDISGQEQVAGCVALQEGKTQFSFEELLPSDQNLLSIEKESSAIIASLEDSLVYQDQNVIYLYFEVDPKIQVVRVLIIKNTFLADNPFDIVEFSSVEDDFQDDEDDFFACSQEDDLSNLNLQDVQMQDPVELSYYDKIMFAACAFLTVQSYQCKQAYKNFTDWLTHYYER